MCVALLARELAVTAFQAYQMSKAEKKPRSSGVDIKALETVLTLGQITCDWSAMISSVGIAVVNTVGPLCPRVLHPQLQPTSDQKYSVKKKSPKNSEQNLSLPHAEHDTEST